MVVQAAISGNQPTAWSGDLVPIPKQKVGGSLCVPSFRPITIGDATGMALYGWTRGLLLAKVSACCCDTQCGGLAGKGTDIAGHMIRSFFMPAEVHYLSATGGL